jgi:hypothetical protein
MTFLGSRLPFSMMNHEFVSNFVIEHAPVCCLQTLHPVLRFYDLQPGCIGAGALVVVVVVPGVVLFPAFAPSLMMA